MDNLVWVQELIEAPDLEALGTVLAPSCVPMSTAARRLTSGSWPSTAPSSTKSGAIAPGRRSAAMPRSNASWRRGIFRKTGVPMIAIASR